MKIKCTLPVILFTLYSASTWAQECSPASTTADQFQLNDDSTTTIDSRTQLQWQRCSVGQHWENSSCQGEALLLTHAQAQEQSTEGWRLPTLHELSGIAELRCSHPAINRGIFPNTPAGDFWTTTVFANSSELEPKYWQVQFIYGETNLGGAASKAYVRLVKNTD